MAGVFDLELHDAPEVRDEDLSEEEFIDADQDTERIEVGSNSVSYFKHLI